MSFASVGVHARNDAIQTADQQAVQTAHVKAVKLRVGGNDLGDIVAYRAAGVASFHARLYTEEPAHDSGMTAAKFVQVFTPAMQGHIAKGITAFEIHNEPNLTIEGYNVSWHSPQQFAAWFLQIAQGLRAQFGHTIRLGFSGLSPGEASGPRIVSDRDFFAGCQDAIAAADFLCVHTYWQSRAELEDITASPVCCRPRSITAALAPLARWSTVVDPRTHPARPVMPTPSLLRLAWPTDPQYVGQITLVYGENQQGYYDSSGDQHWLHGGHAGHSTGSSIRSSRDTAPGCT